MGRRVAAVVAGQITLDGRGGFAKTPNIPVGDHATIGRYKLSDGDIQTGFRINLGSMNGPGVLYPVDTSRLDRTTTITIIKR